MKQKHKIVTKQEALDRFIADRIMGYIPCARDENNSCVYNKAVNGGCAIGVHIPDELYRQEFDAGFASSSTSVRDLFRTFPEVAEVFEDPHSSFWSLLQKAHDSLNPTTWQAALRHAVESMEDTVSR